MRAEKGFSADVSSVRAARQFVSKTLSDLPASFVEDVVLMVSELATNAITHADSPFTLRLDAEAASLRIEISDAGHDLPRRRTPRPDEPFGRGLHIVDTLSESWGVELGADGGKTIWIVVPLPQEMPAEGEAPILTADEVAFDELVPTWTFPSRPFPARLLIAVGVPIAFLPVISWFTNRYDARLGPFVALVMMFAAATAGWPGAVISGLALTIQYWYFSATPVHMWARPTNGSGVALVGFGIMIVALTALTVRIDQIVQRMRRLDRERRDTVDSQADLRRRAERTASQAEAVLAIGTALTSARSVQGVAEAALREFNMPAVPTFASIALIDNGHLMTLASIGASDDLISDIESVDLRRSPWLGGVLEGEPMYIEDRADFALRYPSDLILDRYRTGSWLVVPFRTEGSVGIISVHYEEPQPLRDYRLYFSLISELLGTSLERARIEDQQRRQHRELQSAFAERDRIARTLSTTLLPPALPRLNGFRASAWLMPAHGNEVAGDFYDLFAVEGDSWVGVLGDVCGKGAEAAAVTSLARYAARTAALDNPDPAHIARVANTALDAEPSDLFCTAAIVRYVHSSGEIDVTLAGHLQARMVCDGEVTRLGRYGGALGLGAMSPTVDRYSMPVGALVVLFSDGLVERDPSFGENDLDAFLANAKGRNATELASDIRGVVEGLSRRHPDDVAVLVLERLS